MNTKPIPIIITLSAASVSCLISILQGVDFPTFLVRLLLTVLFFYLIGIVAGILLYNAFPPPPKEEAVEGENADEAEGDAGSGDTDGEESQEDASPADGEGEETAPEDGDAGTDESGSDEAGASDTVTGDTDLPEEPETLENIEAEEAAMPPEEEEPAA